MERWHIPLIGWLAACTAASANPTYRSLIRSTEAERAVRVCTERSTADSDRATCLYSLHRQAATEMNRRWVHFWHRLHPAYREMLFSECPVNRQGQESRARAAERSFQCMARRLRTPAYAHALRDEAVESFSRFLNSWATSGLAHGGCVQVRGAAGCPPLASLMPREQVMELPDPNVPITGTSTPGAVPAGGGAEGTEGAQGEQPEPGGAQGGAPQGSPDGSAEGGDGGGLSRLEESQNLFGLSCAGEPAVCTDDQSANLDPLTGVPNSCLNHLICARATEIRGTLSQSAALALAHGEHAAHFDLLRERYQALRQELLTRLLKQAALLEASDASDCPGSRARTRTRWAGLLGRCQGVNTGNVLQNSLDNPQFRSQQNATCRANFGGPIENSIERGRSRDRQARNLLFHRCYEDYVKDWPIATSGANAHDRNVAAVSTYIENFWERHHSECAPVRTRVVREASLHFLSNRATTEAIRSRVLSGASDTLSCYETEVDPRLLDLDLDDLSTYVTDENRSTDGGLPELHDTEALRSLKHMFLRACARGDDRDAAGRYTAGVGASIAEALGIELGEDPRGAYGLDELEEVLSTRLPDGNRSDQNYREAHDRLTTCADENRTGADGHEAIEMAENVCAAIGVATGGVEAAAFVAGASVAPPAAVAIAVSNAVCIVPSVLHAEISHRRERDLRTYRRAMGNGLSCEEAAELRSEEQALGGEVNASLIQAALQAGFSATEVSGIIAEARATRALTGGDSAVARAERRIQAALDEGPQSWRAAQESAPAPPPAQASAHPTSNPAPAPTPTPAPLAAASSAPRRITRTEELPAAFRARREGEVIRYRANGGETHGIYEGIEAEGTMQYALIRDPATGEIRRIPVGEISDARPYRAAGVRTGTDTLNHGLDENQDLIDVFHGSSNPHRSRTINWTGSDPMQAGTPPNQMGGAIVLRHPDEGGATLVDPGPRASYRFPPGTDSPPRGYRVAQDETVIVPVTPGQPTPVLGSTGYSSCTGTTIRARTADGREFIALSHIGENDQTGAFTRLRDTIRQLRAQGAVEFDVVSMIDPRSAGMPGGGGRVLDADGFPMHYDHFPGTGDQLIQALGADATGVRSAEVFSGFTDDAGGMLDRNMYVDGDRIVVDYWEEGVLRRQVRRWRR